MHRLRPAAPEPVRQVVHRRLPRQRRRRQPGHLQQPAHRGLDEGRRGVDQGWRTGLVRQRGSFLGPVYFRLYKTQINTFL